jgi:hypothetical protein
MKLNKGSLLTDSEKIIINSDGSIPNDNLGMKKTTNEVLTKDTIVKMMDDGTVGKLDILDQPKHGPEVSFLPYGATYIKSCKLDSTRIFISYHNTNDSKGYSIIGTLTEDNNMSFGIPYVMNNIGIEDVSVSLIDTDKVFITYAIDNGSALNDIAIVATISNTVITYGSEYNFADPTGWVVTNVRSCKLDTNKALIVFKRIGSGDPRYSIVANISGNVITTNKTKLQELTDPTIELKEIIQLDTNKVFIAYRSNGLGISIIATIATDDITYGSSDVFDWEPSNTTDYNISLCSLSTTSVFISYSKYLNLTEQGLNCLIANISGSVITYDPDNYVVDTSISNIHIDNYDTNQVIISYQINDACYSLIATYTNHDSISHPVINFSNPLIFNDDISITYDTLFLENGKCLFTYRNNYDIGLYRSSIKIFENEKTDRDNIIGVLKNNNINNIISLNGTIHQMSTEVSPGVSYYVDLDGLISNVISDYFIGTGLTGNRILLKWQ